MSRGPTQKSADVNVVKGQGGAPEHEPNRNGSLPTDKRPWEDPTKAPSERFASYKLFVAQKMETIIEALDRCGTDLEKKLEIQYAAETKRWVEEAESLRNISAEIFCERRDIAKVLGCNFLGAEAWLSLGIDIGDPPPLPASVTWDLLNSECPFHPGEKVKDTHLLVLIPKTVDGNPYSLSRLMVLCETRKGSGSKLFYDTWAFRTSSKYRDSKVDPPDSWIVKPQTDSQWILLPKSDPDPKKVPKERHFRSKYIMEQQQVHEQHYEDYREAHLLELTTAIILNDLVNGEPRMLEGWNTLRCADESYDRGRRGAGYFRTDGLWVEDHIDDGPRWHVGLALARKL
ncbi:MAG: hypothetical protein RL518_2440 [Pseudomonadota bacterium]